MCGLLKADVNRAFSQKWLWLCTLFMVAIAVVMALIQYAGMDYTVAMDRVVFLPMAFYGIAVAALISIFVGEDFGDGVIRSKIVSGATRGVIYLSGLLTCCLACASVYLVTVMVTVTMGLNLFEVNVTAGRLAVYLALGLLTCFAYACIFCAVSMLCHNRAAGIVVCMLLAFGMLFLCLHTNMVLTQEPYKNGMPNPAYVSGIKRTVYELLHDLNPSGQAAQLSAMNCLNLVRYAAADLLWLLLAVVGGRWVFKGMDAK